MIDRISDHRLRRLYAHYLEVRGDRLMPARSDIDPLHLGPVLPNIWLCDFEAEHCTFRYRLAGEEVNAAFGTRVAGLLLSDVVKGERFSTVNQLFLKVVREQLVLYAEGPIYRCTDRMTLGERLVFPLSSDGRTADGLVGATVRGETIDLDSQIRSEDQMYDFLSLSELAGPASHDSGKRVLAGC